MNLPAKTFVPGGIASPDKPRESTAMSVARWTLMTGPLAYLWFQYFSSVSPEWSTNPQYSFGWIVPMLCAGLIARRVQSVPPGSTLERGRTAPGTMAIFAFVAFLYLPAHLIQAAIPEWRPIQWSLGIEAVSLTLCGVYFLMGRRWLKELAFPLCFILVATPWPSLIETPVMQGLTRLTSRTVVECLGWAGIPALQHGNVLEVGKGVVGVEEACSGIRSFQTSLMISLFFGEFYRMRLVRRLVLIPIGFGIAMVCNVCRVSFLTLAAAKEGTGAVERYHDEAGLTITFICTALLWLLAWLTSRKSAVGTAAVWPKNGNPTASSRALLVSAAVLTVWICAVEIGVEAWFRVQEARVKPEADWSLSFPTDNPTFKAIPLDEKTGRLLRCDQGEQGTWTDVDGVNWNGYYFNWNPGRVAGYLAKRHTPEICMAAVGNRMISGPTLSLVHVHGVVLPVRSYIFKTAAGPVYVFHCRWEAGVSENAYMQHDSTRFNLVRAIWNGRGNQGQKVIEFMVRGCAGLDEAEVAVKHELESSIVVKKLAKTTRL